MKKEQIKKEIMKQNEYVVLEGKIFKISQEDFEDGMKSYFEKYEKIIKFSKVEKILSFPIKTKKEGNNLDIISVELQVNLYFGEYLSLETYVITVTIGA